MSDYSELKKLAEEATPGPWEAVDYRSYSGNQPHWYIDTSAGKADIADSQDGTIDPNHWDDVRGERDMKFIAASNPSAVLSLICELEKIKADRKACWEEFKVQGRQLDKLKAENEAMRKDRTDWQKECLKRGFEYVRESDDHYVLADVPEMADLLGALLGVEVRTKDNDAYGEANSTLKEEIDGLINTIHAQESMRKDSERWRFVRNAIPNGSPYAVWSEGKKVFLGKFADEAVDAEMAKSQ